MDYKVTDTELIGVANAIRTKGGTSAQLEWPSGFVSAIGSISGGSKNILSGTSAPSANDGSDGDIYLQYVECPIGYNLLRYIESTGTQYIDTGIPARVQMRVEVDCQWQSSGDQTVIGGSGNANNNTIYLGYNSSTNTTYVGYASSWHDFNTGAVNRDRHKWVIDLKDGVQKITVDDVEKATTSNTFTETTSTTTLYLFARSGKNANFVGKIYSVKIYDYLDNESLIMHLVPAIRNSDSAIGMYDLVNDTFLENIGTGTFSGGGSISDRDIVSSFLKVNGAWQQLIGSDIEDVNTGEGY